MDWTVVYGVCSCAAAAAAVVFVGWYYRRNIHIQPKLHYVESDLHNYILQSRKRFTSPYRPPFWLQNNHLHTLIAAYLPTPKINFKREYIHLDDGGAVALDWVTNNEDYFTSSTTVLIVLPGLTATREDMGDLCNQAISRGYRVMVFNKRGHGDSVLVTPKLQGVGDTSDLRHCIMTLKDRFPLAQIVAVGSSAGSALLASYLGEYGAECILTTGASISPGYDLWEILVKHVSPVYQYLLVSCLKKLVKKHSEVLASVIDLNAASRSTTFAEFDTQVYCKMYGYKDIAEYWDNHNPMRNIRKITVPALCINSLDDPVFPAGYIPFGMFKENSDWLLVTTDKGGHCGFIEEDLTSWSNKIALDYIDAVIEYQVEVSRE